MHKVEFEPIILIKLKEICVILSKRFWVNHMILEINGLEVIGACPLSSFVFALRWLKYWSINLLFVFSGNWNSTNFTNKKGMVRSENWAKRTMACGVGYWVMMSVCRGQKRLGPLRTKRLKSNLFASYARSATKIKTFDIEQFRFYNFWVVHFFCYFTRLSQLSTQGWNLKVKKVGLLGLWSKVTEM